MNRLVDLGGQFNSMSCHKHRRDFGPGALDFSASGHLYATHPLHAFAARLPPPLARWAIETFTDPGDYVLDIMCGSGTTLVEAVLTGRHAWGADIDPLARMITLAKATLIPTDDVNRLTEDIATKLTSDRIDDRWRPEIDRFDYWFRPEVSRDLARLRAAIVATTESDCPLRRLAWTVFSSLIVARTSVANARDLVHSRHHYRAWDTDPQTANRFLHQLTRAGKLMSQFHDLLVNVPSAPLPARLVAHDARRTSVQDGVVDLVFFSPPYVSALDYPRAHAFAVAWLADVLNTTTKEYRARAREYVGTDRAALADATREQPLPPNIGHPSVDHLVKQLHSAPAKAWVVHRYFRDITLILQECMRVTRPGGHVVLVVCPSNIRRVRIPTHTVFAELAPAVSDGRLVVENMYERTIHDHRRVMPYLENSFGERMRTEYVLVCRRGPDSRSTTTPVSGDTNRSS